MASKVQQEKFNKKVEKIVLTFGGKQNASLPYRWTLQTKAGELLVTVHEAQASKLFSIFCCFEEPQFAAKVLTDFNKSNLNFHSGKWNYHCSKEQECLDSFTASLKEIETETELAGLYDLRISPMADVPRSEKIARAIRDCFLRHNGKLNKILMDETIKAVGKNSPDYKAVWKNFNETFEIVTKDNQYINPYHID